MSVASSKKSEDAREADPRPLVEAGALMVRYREVSVGEAELSGARQRIAVILAAILRRELREGEGA